MSSAPRGPSPNVQGWTTTGSNGWSVRAVTSRVYGSPSTSSVVPSAAMGEEVMRQALEAVVAGRGLDSASARAVMDRIMEGEATPAQIGALIAALRTKGETVDELTGMVESMRAHPTPGGLSIGAVGTPRAGGG